MSVITLNSEAEIAEYLNGGGLPSSYKILTKGNRFTFAGGVGGISPEAQAVLAKFPNPLAVGEEAKIIQIVDLMVLGNYTQYDYFFGWFLTDPVNRLTSWFGTKTATAVNSPIFNEFGILTSNSKYIDTGIVPSTDLTNATLNDTHTETYIYEGLQGGTGTHYAYGCNDVSVNFISLAQSAAGIAAFTNTNAAAIYGGETVFASKKGYGAGRIVSTNHEVFVNRSQVSTGVRNSTGLPAVSIYVGTRNGNGSPANGIASRQSYFLIGGGFDLTALNTELNLVQSLFNLN